jgi:hypothetical protein
MLHERSLHAGRVIPQALLFISATEDAGCGQNASDLLHIPAALASSLGN